jgi:hypothetical protein
MIAHVGTPSGVPKRRRAAALQDAGALSGSATHCQAPFNAATGRRSGTARDFDRRAKGASLLQWFFWVAKVYLWFEVVYGWSRRTAGQACPAPRQAGMLAATVA